MIKKMAADDLFEKSSMTFGEHLEELRRALSKALIWLAVGTAVGLMLAEKIVRYIETPLKKAISTYHVERAMQQFEKINGKKPRPEIAEWLTEYELLAECALVDPMDIEALNKNEAAPSLTENSSQVSQPSGNEATSSQSAEQVKSTLKRHPYQGVDLELLNRLQPIVLWQTIPNKMIALTPIEPFMMWLKAGLIAGVIFGAPGIFWHIWQFFAAGLYPHERRYVYWYLPLSLVLFFSGVALAFFVIFPLILNFLTSYSSSLDVELTPRLSDYMSFVLMLPLGFGLAFQLPIVMLGLHRFGVISADVFLSQWRIAVLVISFLAMVLTPADPYSMIGLAVPLIFLYFFGILLCHYMPKGAGIGSLALDP